MNSNDFLNPLNGQEVGHFSWPFYRYKAVIPNQLNGDILVWLYLSLIVLTNEKKKKSREEYSETVKNEVKLIINKSFSNIIDNQTLEAVINNAEQDYVYNNKQELKEETVDFLETFKNLFADTCETRIIYQDAVAGEVLPFFDNNLNIYDSNISDDEKFDDIQNTKEPSSYAIKRAYEQYVKLKKFNNLSNDTELESEEDFFDEDEQTFLDNGDDEFLFIPEDYKKEEKKSLKNMDVILISGSKVILNVDMLVYIEDNKIAIKSPFGKLADNWLAKCLSKWKNISEARYQKISELEKEYCIDEERKIQSFKELSKGDFASTLKYCETLYRLVDSLNNDKIRRHVAILEEYFKIKNEDAYIRIGKILESLVYDSIKYNVSNDNERKNVKLPKDFYKMFDHKFQYSSVKYDRLTKYPVFSDWQRGYKAFKADIADIILKTNIIKSPKIYDDFIEDIFYLYNKRNTIGGHYSKNRVEVDCEDINKLTKVVKVLLELI